MTRDDALRRALTSQLLQSGRQWRRIAEAELKSLGLSEALATPLIWISRLGGGVRQITLAARIGIEGASLVRLLDQLADAGLAERRPHPEDRRAKRPFLTDAARPLLDHLDILGRNLMEPILAGVDAESNAFVRTQLGLIKENLRTILQNRPEPDTSKKRYG